ncbi:MAG: hypothetical protein M9916_10430 [Crocinitomicaceae bacterium]|nr:hypothetical protein [Crocinitomicaceae bacterium]
MSKNCFIFVVCGAKEHIDTLHFSLEYLKKYSKNEIWVLTDTSRNEIPVQHKDIIDVVTPKEFNNHQASIYLKTGIHNYFPKGNKYCYLDTDVVALNQDVDRIFDEYSAPITFANDHFNVNHFSVYAINCNCLEKFNNIEKEIEHHVEMSKRNSFYWFKKLLYIIPTRFYRLNKHFKLEKKTGIWYNHHNEPITHINAHCSHLTDVIKKEMDIAIDGNWKHFNGGVFLFDDNSHSFLNAWHKLTTEKFDDPYWRTRDQGTLIATTWKFELQNHKTLDKKWNFIADSKNDSLHLDKENDFFTDDNWKTKIKPNFIHIFYRFGDKTWDVWNYVTTK